MCALARNVLAFDRICHYLHVCSVSFKNHSASHCGLKAAAPLTSTSSSCTVMNLVTLGSDKVSLCSSLLLPSSFNSRPFQRLLCEQRLLTASKLLYYFFSAESPDHPLLVKGTSAPLKIKTKGTYATISLIWNNFKRHTMLTFNRKQMEMKQKTVIKEKC